MATVESIVEGLKILAIYAKDGMESHDICAEHDIVYGPGDSDLLGLLTLEEQQRLESLGWFLDTETDSWAHFV